MKATSTEELRSYLMQQIELYSGLVDEARMKIRELDELLKNARLLMRRINPEGSE